MLFKNRSCSEINKFKCLFQRYEDVKKILRLIGVLCILVCLAGCISNNSEKAVTPTPEVRYVYVTVTVTEVPKPISTQPIVSTTNIPTTFTPKPTGTRHEANTCDPELLNRSPNLACCGGKLYNIYTESCCYGNVIEGEWHEGEPYDQCCIITQCFNNWNGGCCWKAQSECFCI
jgi:hypothetical protein